jgi:G2/mitotic-specific cyclin 1/2
MSFLRRASKADDYDIQTRTLAKYLMEITLLDHRFLDKPGSLIASSALYLARRMLNRGSWVFLFNKDSKLGSLRWLY